MLITPVEDLSDLCLDGCYVIVSRVGHEEEGTVWVLKGHDTVKCKRKP